MKLRKTILKHCFLISIVCFGIASFAILALSFKLSQSENHVADATVSIETENPSFGIGVGSGNIVVCGPATFGMNPATGRFGPAIGC